MAKLLIPVEKIEEYIEAVKQDYRNWNSGGIKKGSEIALEMEIKFCNSVKYEVLNKFIKIVQGGSVHSFIVNSENYKFPVGAVLKAASWKAPALNYSRGNVLDGSYKKRVRWTGIQ